MNNSLNFCQLNESAIPQLLLIEQEQDFPWSQELLLECFRTNYRCYALIKNKEIIGFAIVMLVAGEAELLNIAIRKVDQRKGYGKQLLQYSLAQAIAEGSKKIYLEVRVSNLPAQKLYQQFGFKKVGERENYYQTKEGREDAEVYCLDLIYKNL